MPFGWIYGAMIFLHINQGVEQQIIRFHDGAMILLTVTVTYTKSQNISK